MFNVTFKIDVQLIYLKTIMKLIIILTNSYHILYYFISKFFTC